MLEISCSLQPRPKVGTPKRPVVDGKGQRELALTRVQDLSDKEGFRLRVNHDELLPTTTL